MRRGRGASGFSTVARLLRGSAPGLPIPHYKGGLPHPGVWPSVSPPQKAAGHVLARTTCGTLFCPLWKKSCTSHHPREAWKTLALRVVGICPAHFCKTVRARLWFCVLCSKSTRLLRSSRTRTTCCPLPLGLGACCALCPELHFSCLLLLPCTLAPTSTFPSARTPLLCSHDSPAMTSVPQHFHRSKLLGYESSSPAKLTDSEASSLPSLRLHGRHSATGGVRQMLT